MPRLLGKSSRTPLYIGITLLVAATGAVVLEYAGVIDIIPGFGQDLKTIKRSELSHAKSPIALDAD